MLYLQNRFVKKRIYKFFINYYVFFPHQIIRENSNRDEKISLFKSQLFYECYIRILYSNIEIFHRIFVLQFAAINCTAERMFSSLKRVKSYSRSTVQQEKLKSFVIYDQ